MNVVHTNPAGRFISKMNPKRWIHPDLTDFREIPEYGIEIYTCDEPKIKAKAFVGKSKYANFFYWYPSIEQREAALEKWIANVTRNIQSTRDLRAKKKALTNEMKASDHFAVEDIVVNSWGYDQTNVEFYRVIEILPKSIRVREVRQEIVPGSEGMMSANVIPTEEFLEKKAPFVLKLKMTLYNGKPEAAISNPSSSYYFRKWEGKPQYSSWYA